MDKDARGKKAKLVQGQKEEWIQREEKVKVTKEGQKPGEEKKQKQR